MQALLKAALLQAALLVDSFQPRQPTRRHKLRHGAADDYAQRWDALVLEEYRATADELRKQRTTWSRRRLEEAGVSLFGTAAPHSELFGEKILRVTSSGESRVRDSFTRGDVLTLTFDAAATPREVAVVEAGTDWLTVGVGETWPGKTWEARRRPGSVAVRLDKSAPRAPLAAQRDALSRVAAGTAGAAATILATAADDAACAAPPGRLARSVVVEFAGIPGGATAPSLDLGIRNAIAGACADAQFTPNARQSECVAWALGRTVALVRGPPGTGKTRTASLLISSALRLGGPDGATPRVLAVTHSNGAADVLLAALHRAGVNAIRAGRPTSVSPEARRFTTVALAEQHPEVVSLRKRATNASLPQYARSDAMRQAYRCVNDVKASLVRHAQIVVASCVGGHALLEADAGTFDLVVLDEAAQTTEPALCCALAAAKAEQIVFFGDTRQLPPTVVSADRDLRRQLGLSPMERLERRGVGLQTLHVQYRMPPTLVEFPSKHFYRGIVQSSDSVLARTVPGGFVWPTEGLPLAFLDVDGYETKHRGGGLSNEEEVALVVDVVSEFLDGDAANVVVLSPYAKQVSRIRGALRREGVKGVRVGSVDSFQGQEADVVVFSAVRSNDRGEIGFVSDKRRLNVALTRARRGLVVVGDAVTLSNSHHWTALIELCRRRDCVVDFRVK